MVPLVIVTNFAWKCAEFLQESTMILTGNPSKKNLFATITHGTVIKTVNINIILKLNSIYKAIGNGNSYELFFVCLIHNWQQFLLLLVAKKLPENFSTLFLC